MANPAGQVWGNDHLVGELLPFLDATSLGRAECVCVAWRRLSTDLALWSRLCLATPRCVVGPTSQGLHDTVGSKRYIQLCRSLVADDKWLVRLHIAFAMDTVLPRMEGSDAAHVLGAFAEVLDDAFGEFGVARELLLLALVCDEAAWITHHLALLAEKQQDYDQATTSTTPICVVFSTNNRVMALRLVDQAAAVEQCVVNLLPDLVETTARKVVQRYKLTAAAVVQHMPDLCRPVTCKQDFDSLAPLMGLLYYLNGDTDAAMALWAAYIRRLANIHSPEYAFAGYCTGMVLHVADRRPAAAKAIKKAFTVDAHNLQYQNVDLVLREAAHPPSNIVSTEHGDRRRLRALTCRDWTSGCMRQQVMMEEGAPVWVMHAARWNVAVIQSISQHGTISCCLVDTPALVEVDATARKDNIHPCNPVEQHRSGVDDLTTLVHLHEPAILNTLRVRYRNDQIYTRAGTILVAVNPFQSLDLYDDATQRRYIHAGRTRRDGDSVLAPHVFQVADRAYHEMLSTRHNQSILVSGESGAGKTETTKLIMTYLASVSSSRADNAVRDRILESTPILEAFGNAMTTRNSNSSRFGKFIRLGFDAASGELVGASIATYLLERVRLISHGVGERNYHIFYELCASPASKSLLGLDRSFAYLESSIMGHRSRRDGVDDAAQFEVTHHAMTTIGLSNHNIASVLQVVAAVLHLGNLEFVPVQGGTSCRLSYDDDTTRFCSSLLGIAYDHMQEALTTRRIKAGGDIVTVGLSPDAAAHSRDVVAKSMYARLFEWLVGRINAATSSPTTLTLHLIGVVDIFGFESFATNSLEQLCINYANEKLQQLFTKYVFELEQREYVAEGIPWTLVAYPNNDACVTLFESRPHGLFSLLDEQCMIPRGNDKQLLATMHGKLSSAPPFTSSRAQLGKGQFTVCHYAGPVVYSTDGFCDKNKDNVHPEALEFLNLSSHDLLHTTNESPPPHHHHPRHAKSRRVSAKERGQASTSCIQKFQGQLKALLGELDTSELHFIRCIKPNDLGRPHVVDDARFLDQLRCSGLLEVTELTRLRHPVRMSHSHFVEQFRCLFPTTSTDRNDVARMLRHWGVASPVVGVSKVYFDHALLTHLLQARELRVRVAVRTLHRFAAALAHRRQTLRRLRLQAATRTVCRAMLDTIHHRRTVRVVQAAHAQRVIAWAWKCYRHAMHHKRYMEAAEHTARQEQRVMVACHALQTWVRRCQLRQALVRHARQLTTATTATTVMSSTRPSDYLRDFGTPPRHPLPYVNTLVSTKNSIMSHWDVARDTSSTSSSSMDAGDDSTYEITWECGMLGIHFNVDAGQVVVQRLHVTLSTCIDIFAVSVGDVLLAVNNVPVILHGSTTYASVMRYVAQAPKPVVLQLKRARPSPHHVAVSLQSDEYELLWGRKAHPSLGIEFKWDSINQVPVVVHLHTQVGQTIPGRTSVCVGDWLTHVQDDSLRQKHSTWTAKLQGGGQTVLLRFQRAGANARNNADVLAHGGRLSDVEAACCGFDEVQRWSWNPKHDETLHHLLYTDDDASLGLVLKQPAYRFYLEVSDVKAEGAVHRQRHQPRRRILRGDQLVCVNHQNIRVIGHSSALAQLKHGPKPVLLTFRRSKPACNMYPTSQSC
ncbi:hypothetical protein DYB37_011222 [Aphanomyces astaci]|uniref:Myosin motor domain-containing protein n=1 Tax=Aphanomyces astaci TaxID=112090 RepID=A0A418F653_APHAT|nr:hypothetical protein DYB37_011222 [Aphanomyces astaci]